VMDGLTATRAIRAYEAQHGRPATPVIAFTAHAFKEDIDKSLAAGCTAHLTKPIKKQALLAALAQATRHAGPAPLPDEAAEGPPADRQS